MEGLPGFLAILGFEGGPEGRVGIVSAEDVDLEDEEPLLVVVGVDEPPKNLPGTLAPPNSRSEHCIRMPLKELARWSLLRARREPDLPPVEGVVGLAVVELGL